MADIAVEWIPAVVIGLVILAFVILYWVGPFVQQYDQDNRPKNSE